MNAEQHSKISATHLLRSAYLYVRQSTLRQVLENTESTKRQYALRERAIALGWPAERIVVIDSDLGRSGADSDREGFARLVAAVGLGEVGVVLGLEVSRLARSSTDWHRLLEICALTDTLICDEDGLYDPGHFNDRLLLGLKGTMSEAELHVLRARLLGGQRAKAARGELEMRMPVGSVTDPVGRVVLDPDAAVVAAVRTFFRRSSGRDRRRRPCGPSASRGSCSRAGSPPDPMPARSPGARSSTTTPCACSRTPATRGRSCTGGPVRSGLRPGPQSRIGLPREEWHTLLLDRHPGYISWDEYEANLRRLAENAQAHGAERRAGAAEGRSGTPPGHRRLRPLRGPHGRPLLLRPRHPRPRVPLPARVDRARPAPLRPDRRPWDRPGDRRPARRDRQPARARGSPRHRGRARGPGGRGRWPAPGQVERARYEAELAQRRYLRVDPDNRLVADSLEADWNAKLRALADAQDAYERARGSDRLARRPCRAGPDPRPRHRLPATLGGSGDAPAGAQANGPAPRRGRDPAAQRRDHRPCPLPGRCGPDAPAALAALRARPAADRSGRRRRARPPARRAYRCGGRRAPQRAVFQPGVGAGSAAASCAICVAIRARGPVHPPARPRTADPVGDHRAARCRPEDGQGLGARGPYRLRRLQRPRPATLRAAGPTAQACGWCGDPIPAQPALRGGKKWCSTRCCYAAYRSRKRAGQSNAQQAALLAASHGSLPDRADEVQSLA